MWCHSHCGWTIYLGNNDLRSILHSWYGVQVSFLMRRSFYVPMPSRGPRQQMRLNLLSSPLPFAYGAFWHYVVYSIFYCSAEIFKRNAPGAWDIIEYNKEKRNFFRTRTIHEICWGYTWEFPFSHLLLQFFSHLSFSLLEIMSKA